VHGYSEWGFSRVLWYFWQFADSRQAIPTSPVVEGDLDAKREFKSIAHPQTSLRLVDSIRL
jgi:hypothetical protein